jgi:competence protein ComEA
MCKKLLILGMALSIASYAYAINTHLSYASHHKAKPANVVIQKVNINTADKKTLMTIKGINSKKAQNIISYRTKNGNFKSVNDLLKVKGFSKKCLAKISKYLTV